MKKLFLFAGIVAVLALIPLSNLMATQDEAPATTDQIMLISLDEAPMVGHKVAICHFGGHDGDFVTVGAGCGCIEGIFTGEPGNVLVIASKACENGHNAMPRGSFDCNADNVDLIDLDSCNP